MEQLFISIIINNYNYARFLPQAIASALDQTYPNIEVIVVDDCSTDNSRQVIAKFGDRISPVLHKQNGKQGAAFNSGFAKSSGDIIIFLDADDYLYPRAVETIVDTWKPDLAKIHYRLDVVDTDNKPLGYSYPQGSKLDTGAVHKTILSIGTYAGVPTSGNAISRCALEQVFPIPVEFHTASDDFLSVLIPLYGDVAAIETPLGAYRIHASNQWAMTEVTGDRFHRFIRHDIQRCELLKQTGRELGYTVPDNLDLRFFGRVWSRLASLKFDPLHHPVPGDRPYSLVLAGIKAVWQYSNHPWKKKIAFSLWFVWVGLMPTFLAKPAITWLFAPHQRPKPIQWTTNKLRSVMSS